MKKILWGIFIFFAVVIGVYPLAYLFFDMSQGFLAGKTDLKDQLWPFAFYVHISFGGLALFIGWLQFVNAFRNKYLKWHRMIGKVYLISILFSGVAGLYISFFATGGIISTLGFGGLAICWVATSVSAYLSILKGQINDHEYWMIRSYALCFAAVTLRLWIPLSQIGFQMDFLFAYRIISWLCWIPNLIVAEFMIRSLKNSRIATESIRSILKQ